MARNQAQDAQYLYDERSAHYDDSWHPRFARHMVELVSPQPGEHVLDLACGTGLVSLPASIGVGPTGEVVGVDISSGMLAQAEVKKLQYNLTNVDFHRHSITDLDTLEALGGQTFDVIICASALVLLPDPAGALKQWTRYLKPSGRLITDVTHPQSQLAHFTLECVAKALDLSVPSYRIPFQSPESLRAMMETASLRDVEVMLISQMDAEDGRQDLDAYRCEVSEPCVERIYSVSDAMNVFDGVIDTKFAETLASESVRDHACDLFVQEWEKFAGENGEIREIDGVFVGMGRKS